MSDISHTYNTFQNKDDVLIRNILIGTLHSLRDKIYWDNTINSENDKVDVPVYFTVAGSERFLSDIFLNEFKIEQEGIAESVYNKYPRAHVSMEGISIQEEYLTNKFTRANYLKQVDDEVSQYNAEFQNMPVKIDMDIVIYLDSIIDIFKCWEAIMRNVAKTVYFYVDTAGIKIPCHFEIPENIEKERPIEFGFSDKKESLVKFSIEVQADFPVFKEDTSIFAGDRMETIKYTVNSVNTNNTPTRETPADVTDSRGVEFEVTKSVWPTGNNKASFYPDTEQ